MSISGIIAGSQNAINTAGNTVNAVKNLSAGLKNAMNADSVGSAIRSINLPAAGEAIGDIFSAVAAFDEGDEKDWRVRLSIANWSSFQSSPVLAPLKEAGGLIFPYTPTISIDNKASYTNIPTVHTNAVFHAYQSSDPGSIIITAPMYVEDAEQGKYWIAMVHYLRSLTKMFTGSDPKAGNPPPIVHLNAYGSYVFKNVPVVVTGINIQLGNECDYIGVEVEGSSLSEFSALAGQLGGLASTIGNIVPAVSGITNVAGAVLNGAQQAAGIISSFGIGGTSNNNAHVPTNSQFTITLMPVYSRDSMRKFSLDTFVQGGYMNSSVGYI